jgi:ELWxxDGT repeat protein
MKHSYALLALAACTLWPACFLQAQTKPTLFQDINPLQSVPADPLGNTRSGIYGSDIIAWNNALYFNGIAPTGTDSSYVPELWQYDGSSAPARAILMSAAGGYAYVSEGGFSNYKGKLYYSGGNTAAGWELAAYDGVHPPAVVANLSPGASPSSPGYFAVLNGYLFFCADSGMYGRELYRYDGLRQPRRIAIGADTFLSQGSDPAELTPFKGNIYFAAFPPGDTQRRLYQCDQNGNYALAKGAGGLGHVYGLLALEHDLYFIAHTPANGFELYSYDGDTALRLTDIGAGPINGLPEDKISWNHFRTAFRPALYGGALYFAGSTTGVNYQLYKYDLNTRSSALAAALHPSGVSRPSGVPMAPNSFQAYDGSLFFAAYSAAAGYELWKWDGSACALFADMQPGPKGSLAWFDDSVAAYPQRFSAPGFTEFKGQLFFVVVDSLYGRELWRMGTQTNGITQARWQGSLKLYPNPASNSATLALTLPTAQRLSLSLTDAAGREVYHLVDREYPSGTSSEFIPLKGLAPGPYFYRLLGGGQCVAAGALMRQ